MKAGLNPQIDLKRIEFFITYKCTSHCDHCSVYSKNLSDATELISLAMAEKLIKETCDDYKIESIMTFGGEPLLHPDLVCKILKTARGCNIPTRQIITNGYWSNKIVSMITDANDILVSIDCFHEKYLDYEIVKYTVERLKKQTKGNLQLHPVWVINQEDNNPYNIATNKILEEFGYLGVPVSAGNILFPSGRALMNLSEYLPKAKLDIQGTCKDQPYTDMPNDIKSVCVEPNGDIVACSVIGNIHKNTIADILRDYDYEKDPVLKAMVEKRSEGLYILAKENNIELSRDGYYSVCELCKDISKQLRESAS